MTSYPLELFCLVMGLIVTIGPLLAYRRRMRKEDEVDDSYEPTVTVVTPMFNEGEGIRRMIRSVLAQRYPAHKLRLVIVDDCSTDDSYEHAIDEARYEPRVTVLRNPINIGKRRSINRAVRVSNSEIIVSVDSDVTVHASAVRELVRRFTSPEIAAVGGRVDIRNKHENWLTRMQAVKYHYGYHVVKNLERAYRTVMCLSGCLTAYRRSVLVELEPQLEDRRLLGMPITYGEDRFLTRQIIKAGYKTTMTMDAICGTDAPSGLEHYARQQLRWRKSMIVDYLGSVSHIWRMPPLIALHYYAVLGLMVGYSALMVSAIVSGTILVLAAAQLAVILGFGLFYSYQVRHEPPENKVSGLSFLPMMLVVPFTYAVLVPTAALTLGNRNWGTRRHRAPDADLLPRAIAEEHSGPTRASTSSTEAAA